MLEKESTIRLFPLIDKNDRYSSIKRQKGLLALCEIIKHSLLVRVGELPHVPEKGIELPFFENLQQKDCRALGIYFQEYIKDKILTPTQLEYLQEFYVIGENSSPNKCTFTIYLSSLDGYATDNFTLD